jgi:nuclear RNA export factor
MFADLVDNYAVALFRPNMMLAVVDVIVENVPELVALDLSENKLYALDSLSVLSVKLPNLRVLHIGKNRVSFCIHGSVAATDIYVSVLCSNIVR